MTLLTLLLASVWVAAATPTTAIKVDQVGYLPRAPKVAIVVSDTPATDFTVRRLRDGSVVFRGKLPAAMGDADSGDHVQAADFTIETMKFVPQAAGQ